MEKELWKGNEAVAEAAIRAGCKLFFGYPITPQNEIPEYLAQHLPNPRSRRSTWSMALPAAASAS